MCSNIPHKPFLHKPRHEAAKMKISCIFFSNLGTENTAFLALAGSIIFLSIRITWARSRKQRQAGQPSPLNFLVSVARGGRGHVNLSKWPSRMLKFPP